MSRVYDNNTTTRRLESDDIDDKFKSDNEVGATISACYIANVEEVYTSKCK